MSYALSAPLQRAVFEALTGDAALTAIVGSNVFDAMPPGDTPQTYVALGAERVRDASDIETQAAWHEFVITVVTEDAGFQSAKEAAGAVNDVLQDAELSLSRGRLVGLRFLKAQAQRARSGARRIDRPGAAISTCTSTRLGAVLVAAVRSSTRLCGTATSSPSTSGPWG